MQSVQHRLADCFDASLGYERFIRIEQEDALLDPDDRQERATVVGRAVPALIERAIHNSSKCRDIALDRFGSSGSTLIVAEKAGRQIRLIELDPRYVDVIGKCWQNWTGGQAVLDEDERPSGESAGEAADLEVRSA